MNDIVIPYHEAKNLIQEGDVLLFKAGGFIGRGIILYTSGKHSHVALAHWDRDNLYCVEQREFKGGRSVLLDSQVNKYYIDVYRPKPEFWHGHIDTNSGKAVWEKKVLSEETKHNITNTALELTGQPYGWGNIWEFCKCYLPLLHLVKLFKKNGTNDHKMPKNFVCSTVITYSYRKYYADPCPNLADSRTSPADISRSALFDYMFSIG